MSRTQAAPPPPQRIPLVSSTQVEQATNKSGCRLQPPASRGWNTKIPRVPGIEQETTPKRRLPRRPHGHPQHPGAPTTNNKQLLHNNHPSPPLAEPEHAKPTTENAARNANRRPSAAPSGGETRGNGKAVAPRQRTLPSSEDARVEGRARHQRAGPAELPQLPCLWRNRESADRHCIKQPMQPSHPGGTSTGNVRRHPPRQPAV